MEKIGILEGFISSFNPRRYEKIVKQKFSQSFLYLFVLILIISALLSVKFSFALTKIIGEFMDKVGEKIPELRITNGVVSVPVEQPYVYKAENFVFIIDTTGKITSLDDYEAGLLLTKNKIIYKDKTRMKTESYDLSQINSLYVTPEIIKTGIKRGGKIIIPILFLALLIYYLMAKFIQLFLFSLVSLFTNELKKKKLSYPGLLNIGVYGLTPPTLIAVILTMSDFGFRWFALIYILLYILILILAIGRVPSLEKKAMS